MNPFKFDKAEFNNKNKIGDIAVVANSSEGSAIRIYFTVEV